MADTNEFAAAPKVVKPKKKYKEKQIEEPEQDQIKLIYNNLMWDKRVVRGNTYSALVTTSKNAQIPYANTSSNKMNMIAGPEPQQYEQSGNRRSNIEIFTDQFVQTLTDKPPKYEYGAQTDFKIQNAVVRHKMPTKIGQDIQTQIWDDQLFDFDYQVEPLLSVLCARTLEISRMEVLQQQQLNIMKNRQLQLKLEQQKQMQKIKQMYEKQEQMERQNAKRLDKLRREKKKKINTHQRLFSRVIGKQYLRDLNQNTLNYVEGQGFFRSPIDTQIIEDILPTFYKNSLIQKQSESIYMEQAQQLITAAKQMILKEHKWAKEVQKTRRQKIIQKREELARQKNERKCMKGEQKYMKKFLEQEKIQLEKEQEERRLAEQAGEEEQPE